MRPRLLRFFLDANILVDAQVRDLLLRAAEAGLIDVRWSAEVLGETRRALTGRLGLPQPQVDRLTLALVSSFAEADVVGYDHLVNQLVLPDSDDRHVLAAAIHGECDVLVTDNVADFPDSAAPSDADLLVFTADEAIEMVAASYPDAMVAVVQAQVLALRRPPVTLEAFVERLATRAPVGAAAVGAALGLAEYQRRYTQIRAAKDPTGPQQAVQRLLDALAKNDAPAVTALLSTDLAQRLSGRRTPTGAQVLQALQRALEDVLTETGWGFATAHRPHAPDVELVKLLQLGDEARIASGPQFARGHLFCLRSDPSGWTLVDLDGEDPAVIGEIVPPTDISEGSPGPALVAVADEDAPDGTHWAPQVQLAAAFATYLATDRDDETLRLLVTPESLAAWRRDLPDVDIPSDLGLATGVVPAHDQHWAQVEDICYVRFVRPPSTDATYRVEADTVAHGMWLTLQRRPDLGAAFDGWRIFGIGEPLPPEQIPGRVRG